MAEFQRKNLVAWARVCKFYRGLHFNFSIDLRYINVSLRLPKVGFGIVWRGK
jgi:hypothetical protein